MPSLVTFDLHSGDRISDIQFCIEWLSRAGIPALFLVPTGMLHDKGFVNILKEAHKRGVKIGTHAHHHNRQEIDALMGGQRTELAFLETSKKTYEDTFGSSPIVFRSPFWCPLSDRALATLAELGYKIDCSATPQRFPPFSSFPFKNTWVFCKRKIHRHRSGMIMVPTSCLLVPLASPTFDTFRKRCSRTFLELLRLESMARRDTIINVMFHVADLNPDSEPLPRPEFRWQFLFPRRFGGFGFRTMIRESSRVEIAHTSSTIINRLMKDTVLNVNDILTMAP